MRLAYADPPYPGMAKSLYQCEEIDHPELIARLCSYDGWALSTKSNSLRDLLPLCPPEARVAAWVKPFAFMRPNIWPNYAWEPVIFVRPKRPVRRKVRTPHDWLSCNPWGVSSKERKAGGVKGQKPEPFSLWLFGILDARTEDSFDDLFPGSGRVGRCWESWAADQKPPPEALA